jgi:hypothetical protein
VTVIVGVGACPELVEGLGVNGEVALISSVGEANTLGEAIGAGVAASAGGVIVTRKGSAFVRSCGLQAARNMKRLTIQIKSRYFKSCSLLAIGD